MRRFREVHSGFSASEPEVQFNIEPVFAERASNELVKLMFAVSGEDEYVSLQSITVTFSDESNTEALSALTAWYTGVVPGVPVKTKLATVSEPALLTLFKFDLPVASENIPSCLTSMLKLVPIRLRN